ncbi:MAG: response regulator receiver protein [Massilibacillus sp.]|jgi:two-component system response regulator YcbB|nr:response regulator receiver protein [Massilibacillus sp.]
MRFFLIDDDEVIRSMLTEIIEDYDLGKVVGEADSGASISGQLLEVKNVDILLIDMLMPIRDGIQTVKAIKDDFHGKIIMISQVENKEMVGKAYNLGVDHYITKPINRNEVVSVIKNATEHMNLRKLVRNIENSLNIALRPEQKQPTKIISPEIIVRHKLIATGEVLLSELGIAGEKGSKDLLNILNYLQQHEKSHHNGDDFPSLKNIFQNIAIQKFGSEHDQLAIQKECKAIEQRLRRTVFQALINLASIGIIDYANPKFEDHAGKFFDFAEVRKVMLLLENQEKPSMSQAHINIKKFIKVLFIEAKKV